MRWGHVPFTPKSGHWEAQSGCPLSANSGHSSLNGTSTNAAPIDAAAYVCVLAARLAITVMALV